MRRHHHPALLLLVALGLGGCRGFLDPIVPSDSGTPGETAAETDDTDDTDIPVDTGEEVEVEPEWDGTFIDVAAGWYSTCALKSNGWVVCWGDGLKGESVPPFGTFTDISSGSAFYCGITAGGMPACWGGSSYGVLDAPDGTFVSVKSGSSHSCAMAADGTLSCWGTSSWESYPTGPFTDFAVAGSITCGIESSGRVRCNRDLDPVTSEAESWSGVGAMGEGACGLRDDAPATCVDGLCGSDSPPDVPLKAMDADYYFACGLTYEGGIRCWGLDSSWDCEGMSRAVLSPPEGSFVQISLGFEHGCALERSGGITCWGDSEGGAADVPTFDR